MTGGHAKVCALYGKQFRDYNSLVSGISAGACNEGPFLAMVPMSEKNGASRMNLDRLFLMRSQMPSRIGFPPFVHGRGAGWARPPKP
jgi:hypothetical protein